MRKLQDQQDSNQVTENVDSFDEALKPLVADKKLSEKQKNQLLNEYMQDLQRLNKTRDLGILLFLNPITIKCMPYERSDDMWPFLPHVLKSIW